MQLIISFILLISINITTSSTEIYIEFSKDTSYAQLVSIQDELATKGIHLKYVLIEYNEKQELKALRFEVHTDDGASGSGTCKAFTEGHILSLKLDNSPKAKTSIEIRSGLFSN